jgi:maltose-binding protein MalE
MRSAASRNTVRIVAFLLLISMLLPLLATQLSAPPEPVVIWHAFSADSPEADAVEEYSRALASWRPRLNVQVRALGNQFGSFLVQAIGSGVFPDILLAPVEWVPLLDHIGLLGVPPPEGADEYLPNVALGVLSDGLTMGVPAFTSVLALGRRAPVDFGGQGVPWPDDVQGLVQAARAAAAGGMGGLYWPVADLYYTVPWLLGAGGHIEPPEPEQVGGPPLDPVVDSAVLFWLNAVASVRDVSPELTSDLVQAWVAGNIAYAPVSPGAFAALAAAGAQVELGPIPQGRGFLTTWAWMLSGYGGNPRPEAVRFIARVQAADDEGGPSLALTVGYLPVKARHFTAPAAMARGLNGFLASVHDALPMPAGPLAPELWAVYELALQEFLAGAKAQTVLASLKSRAGELYPPDREP